MYYETGNLVLRVNFSICNLAIDCYYVDGCSAIQKSKSGLTYDDYKKYYTNCFVFLIVFLFCVIKTVELKTDNAMDGRIPDG